MADEAGYREKAVRLPTPETTSAGEGRRVNHKNVYRIYREERLVVRKRGGRKRAAAALPQGANHRWYLDFASDAPSDSCRFRVLCIVDDFTRECLAPVADTSLSGRRVAREFDVLIAECVGRKLQWAFPRRVSESTASRHIATRFLAASGIGYRNGFAWEQSLGGIVAQKY